MTKFIFLILICLLSISSYPERIVSKDNLKAELLTITTSNPQINLIRFIELKPREFKRITGEKLSLKQILSLKIIQAKLKRRSGKGRLADLSLNQNTPRKKPKLWVALLIVLGLAILFFSIAFLIADQVY